MILPPVINDSARRAELVEERRQAYVTLTAALASLRAMAPDSVDYSSDHTGYQYHLARRQHEHRIGFIRALRDRIVDEAMAIKSK